MAVISLNIDFKLSLKISHYRKTYYDPIPVISSTVELQIIPKLSGTKQTFYFADSVGEEFRQGTAQNSCLCFTITGASRGTQMAEPGSAGGSFRHMSGTWAQIGQTINLSTYKGPHHVAWFSHSIVAKFQGELS